MYVCTHNIFVCVEFEAGFIRLLDKMTNGSTIQVNETGTNTHTHTHTHTHTMHTSQCKCIFMHTHTHTHYMYVLSYYVGTVLYYRPGLLVGGTLEHDCSLQRSIGYFLEPLVLLAPFAKKPIRITLRGNTNSTNDPSVSS